MKKQEKIYFTILSIIVLVIVGFAVHNTPKSAEAGIAGVPKDIIGTHTGTTTAPAVFYGNANANGTTSVATYLGSEIDTAVFSIQLPNASSTGFAFNYYIWGSNDNDCGTATTTTIYDKVVKNDINWFPVDPTNTRSYGTINTATTSSVLLTNLNWSCLRFDATASSTKAWVQLRTKTNN